MVLVAFHDPAGRPLAGAVVSIAAAPGEFKDIAMIADDHGEVSVTPIGFGDYEFCVFVGGSARNVVAHIVEGEEAVVLEVD
jgi:hypothetical protein